MSVGSVRHRGQEGSPVLFPQQGRRCIAVVCRTQVCLDSPGSCTEGKKKSCSNRLRRRSYIVCLSICKHVGYRGPPLWFLFCNSLFPPFLFVGASLYPSAGRLARNQDCIKPRLGHRCGMWIKGMVCPQSLYHQFTSHHFYSEWTLWPWRFFLVCNAIVLKIYSWKLSRPSDAPW